MAGTFRWLFGVSLAMLGALLFAGSAWPLAAAGRDLGHAHGAGGAEHQAGQRPDG